MGLDSAPIRAVVVCAFSFASIVSLPAQQPASDPPPPTFRAGTEVVQVDVSVLDRQRHPVKGLTAADFTIYEDGQPRPIETFSVVDLPDRVTSPDAAWMSEVPVDVVSNRAMGEEGRLIVILMDRTVPVGMPTITAREIAVAAVNELGPNDMAALISTSGGVPQNFTSDRQRLLRAINQRDWSTGITAEAQEIEARTHQGFEGSFTSLTDGRCLCGLCVPDTITRVADALQDVARRRKSLLFIGSDFVVQAGPQVQQAELGCGQKLEDAREKMFAALDRSGLTVHGIDPTGLSNIGPTSQASSTLRGGVVGLARTRAVEQTLQSQNNLHVVPDHTGGRTVMNTNAPQARIPDIVRESQSYYLIGFQPSDSDSARPVRSIEVKVNRRNVDVRARRQFAVAGVAAPIAAVPGAEASRAPYAGAIDGLLPSGALALDLQLSAFAGSQASRPTVAVAVGIDAFAPPVSATDRDVPLEVVVAAFDATGAPKASARQTLQLSWPNASGSRTTRVEALTHLLLDPGDYEIRVAVDNPKSQQVASVFSYLTVPAFAATPFSLSTIVMNASPQTSSVPRDALQGLLPVTPTTQRSFRRNEQVGAFLRIYQGPGRTDRLAPVAVRVQIIDSQNRAVRDQAMTLDVAAFETGRAADCRLAIPVAQLAPGHYLLRLEATLGERVAGRAIRFSVE